MFKIVPNPVFAAAVALTVPGQAASGTIEVDFRHKGRKELAAWIEAVNGKQDAELLAEVINGWSGVQDKDGAELAYTPAMLAQLLDTYPPAGGELFSAYLKALTESRVKN